MHELSIASAIAEIAGAHARGRRVTSVDVTIGALRQVVPDALTFAFTLVVEDTPLAGAALAIEHVPARVTCRACSAETNPSEFPFACAACGGLDVDVVAGDELLVEWIELDEQPVAVAGGR